MPSIRNQVKNPSSTFTKKHMKYSKTLTAAVILLATASAHADPGNNSFESRSQPKRHMITQSHSAHGWHANQSERGERETVEGLFGNQSESARESTKLVAVSAVPEPETYAMMLAGIGLIGTIIRRRRGRSEA